MNQNQAERLLKLLEQLLTILEHRRPVFVDKRVGECLPTMNRTACKSLGEGVMAEEGELDVEVAGQKVRAKGYRLVDLIWLPLCLGMFYVGLTLYDHKAEAADNSAKVAQALKESNGEVAKALKESSAATIEAIKDMAAEQRRSNELAREQTCILTLPPDRRTNAAEFCKRISRDTPR